MPREPDLTPELVARVHRVEPDEGPRPERQQMQDADYAECVSQLLSGTGDEALKVFAYGSLIWKPEFEFAHRQRASLSGWHRSFCMKIERWRGTRAQPGLMMALDKGGHCDGVLFTLRQGNKAEQLDKLLRREITNKPMTNVPFWAEVMAENQKTLALAFRSSGEGNYYQGNLPPDEVATILARAAGHWGSGAEYLYNTVHHLEQMGIEDSHLWDLQKRVAAEIAAMA